MLVLKNQYAFSIKGSKYSESSCLITLYYFRSISPNMIFVLFVTGEGIIFWLELIEFTQESTYIGFQHLIVFQISVP